MRKEYKKPKLMISVANEDLVIAKELREKHCVNISAFVREKLKELHNSLNENNKNI